jgi:hemolysin activation/secretion protein
MRGCNLSAGRFWGLPATGRVMAVRGRGRIAAYLYAVLLAVAFVPAAHAQSSTTLDTEEQRRRAQQQAIERERQAQAPRVDLEPAKQNHAIDDGRVPVETPCFKIEQIGLEMPKGLSDLVRAVGDRALSPDPLIPGEVRFAADYLQRYVGQCVGREGINLIVHRVADLILEKGYTTTRVLIPAQDLSSGKFTLELVPGVISAIRFADPHVYGTWRNAFPTGAGRLLNLRELETGLEQMKRVTNQDVDMQIVPGEVTGESDVVITVTRTKPWSMAVSLDDSGLRTTGQLQASANLAVDNPLGLSDIFDIGYSHDANGHSDRYGTRGANAYYSIPYGNWTFTASASQYHYHQRIAGAFSDFVSSGLSKTFDLKAEYLLERNQVQKNSLEFRTGKYFSESFIDGSEVDIQHRDNSYAELGWVHKHYFGAAQFDSTLAYRWGVPWFGAQQDLPNSPTFYYHIETLDSTLSVPFKLGNVPLRYTATVRAQNSTSTLYATEFFSIGSRYTVRGFDGDTMLSAEKGVFLRNDLEMPIASTANSVYLGLDGGEVFGPSAGQLLGRRLAGAVIGLRGSPIKHVFYDLFIGGPLYEPDRFPNHWPVAGFSLSFQL